MRAEEALREKLEALKALNRAEFDYVLIRSHADTVEGALKQAGRSSAWFYRKPKEKRAELEEMASNLHTENALKAWYILEEAAEEAANVKVSGLKDANVWVRQNASSEILGRTVDRKPDKVEISGGVRLIWDPHKPET